MTLHQEAWNLFAKHGIFSVPIKVTPLANGKKDVVGLVRWREEFYDGARDDTALERAWDGHEDAPGIGIFVGQRAGLCALDPDTPEAEEYLRAHKVPRTSSFKSRRGIKRLFRYPSGTELATGHLTEGLELRAEYLLIVPPTPGYEYLPAGTIEEAGLGVLPEWARRNGNRHARRTTIKLGPELPAGQAHTEMTRIVGKLARSSQSPEELMRTATALNAGRLPESELAAIVEAIAAKEHPEPRRLSPSGVSLEDVHEVFNVGLHLPDVAAIDVPIIAVVANLFEIDPVFLLIVAAAARGKTEVVDSLRSVPAVHPLSTLTPATLLSGYRDPRSPAKDNSLLTRLSREGKRVVLMKDFGTILSMHREARSEILAQLREVFDGSFVRADGTGREVSWEGHLGFVAGVTPAIDSHHAVIGILGERFVYFRPQEPARRIAARMTLANVGKDTELREARRDVVARLVAGVDTSVLPPLSDTVTDWIVDLSDFATRARTAVERDGYGSREILSPPSAEAPMRLAKQLASIGRASLAIGYSQEQAGALIERLAFDSLPPIRRSCLDFLRRSGQSRTATVADGIDMPTKTTSRALEDLAVLGVLDRTKKGDADNAANEWLLREPETSEGTPGHVL